MEITKNQLRVNRIRSKIFNISGDICCKCNQFKGDLKMLELHHINPNNKSFGINVSNVKSKNFKLVSEEIYKCIPLCPNCHRMFHLNYWNYNDLNTSNLKDYQIKLIEEYVSK